MPNKAIKLISAVFIVIWTVIIFTEFWHFDKNYEKALQLFQYYDLLVFILAVGSGFIWLIKKRKNKPFKYFNGLSLFGGMLLLHIVSTCLFYGKLNGLDLHISGLFTQVGHIIGVSICIFLVYLIIRLLGTLLTNIFPLNISETDLPYIQIALGLAIFTSLLFLLGIIGILNVFILVPICFIILTLYWRHSLHIIKETLLFTIRIPNNINAIGIFSFLFLALFLILNYVIILRPFPIGSDSLNLYVNIPSLLAEYNGLVNGHQPYNWSLFMSTGLVVFGRIDVVLALSFLGGLLSLFTLFRISRKWLDVNYSALVLLLFYSAPMINFLSYMDMKVDMGLLFITLTILLLYYNWVVPTKEDKQVKPLKGIGLAMARAFFKNHTPSVLKQNRLLVVIGLLAGFAFGIKLTILFFFFALHCTVWFVKGGKLTFLASFFLCFAAIFILKLDVQPGLRQFHQFVPFLQWSLLSIGLGMIAYLFIKRREKLMKVITYSAIIGAFFVLPVLPWLGKNYAETGKLSVNALLNGKKDTPVFDFLKSNKRTRKEDIVIPGIYQLPEETNAVEKKRNKDLNTSISEDLHRFMGYEIMPIRYLSLPYDVFIKPNITKHFTDIGFVLLLLFPLIFLFPLGKDVDKKSILTSLSFMILGASLLLVAIPGAFMNKNQLIDPNEGIALLEAKRSTGFVGDISDMTNRTLLEIYAPINDWISSHYTDKDPFTYSVLILLFLLILTLVYARVKKHSKTTQSLVLLLFMYFFLWWILGSGVAWYGMLIFTLSYIFLLKGIYSKEGEVDKSTQHSNFYITSKKTIILSVCSVWIFFAFTQRTANYFPIDEEKAKHIYFPSISEFQLGNLSEKKLMDYHFPNIRHLSEIINRDKRAKIYRIGSPINFFIDKNDSRVLGDNFLSFFEILMANYKTKEQIIDALKKEGFRYIFFDLNMASYDETPDKTLTAKFTQFLNTLYSNPKVELLATDRQIKLNDTGQVIFAVFQDQGTIVRNGTIALYKIK